MALHNATVRTPTPGDNESCSGFPTSQEASQELVLVGPSQNDRGLKAEVGWRPVGPAGLWRETQLEWKHEGPV